MANVASYRNGLHNTANTYDTIDHGPVIREHLPYDRTIPLTSNNGQTATPSRAHGSIDYSRKNLPDTYPSRGLNNNAASRSDEDIPENMYRPDKDHPEGWIHRDKLAKIESEELQAAGINLSNSRTTSQKRTKNEKSVRDDDLKRDDKHRRLHSPIEHGEEDDGESAGWDLRLAMEIEAENLAAAQMYTNPILRKSGSKIPILAASPLPIPPERYERDTPIVRKRAASGTMSFEGDLSVAKIRNSAAARVLDDSDTNSSAVTPSKPGSPENLRAKSAATTPASNIKPVAPAVRKASAPHRTTAAPNQRPLTRSGEQDRPRTAVTKPEGDPPWLATMYKPDPRLPPDQQLIPTLAKKQMQAQWAEEGAIPKSYDRDFTPIAVHNEQDLAKDAKRRSMIISVVDQEPKDEPISDPGTFALKPLPPIGNNSGRPGTSGSATGSYSTIPKVVGPIRKPSDNPPGPGSANTQTPAPTKTIQNTRGPSSNAGPPTRIQAQNLLDADEKAKKGCGCCIIM